MSLLPLLLAALSTPAWSAATTPQSVEGVEVESADTRAIKELENALGYDAERVDALAERILNSRLSGRISEHEDANVRREMIKQWILQDRRGAASMGVGLAKDDAAGNTLHEDTMLRRSDSVMVENPDAVKGLYGRLKKSAAPPKQEEEPPPDEKKSEGMKSLFEGQGSMADKVLDFDPKTKGPPSEEPRTYVGAAENFYDRLGQANVTGYSPQVMTIQSQLNSRRAPGAPKLVETGRLDFETLSYPLYGMRYDQQGLQKRLRTEINYALAKLLGLDNKYRAEDLSSEKLTVELRTLAKGMARLNPRLDKRLRILERLAGALEDFEKTAVLARDPARITRALLSTLGAKQGSAARWITIAALEEDITRIESEENFLSKELLDAIEAAPVDPGTRASYKRRGEDLKNRLSQLRNHAESASRDLESADWARRLPAVEQMLARNGPLRKDLSRNITNYIRVPFLLHEAFTPRPRWQVYWDDLVLRFLPSSSYGRKIAARQKRLEIYRDIFHRIASGDLDVAHRTLQNAE